MFKKGLQVLSFFWHFVALLLITIPSQAYAYIGPGMGLGLAAIVIGLFVAFILLLVGLIWLPIQRILRQRKQKQQSQNHPSSTKL